MTTDPTSLSPEAFGPADMTDAARAGIAEENLAAARYQLDVVQAQRDRLVEAIGKMISLSPHLVAEAYSVGYTGSAQASEPGPTH